MNKNNNTSAQFWCKYTDKQILEATEQYLYKRYGFKKDVMPVIEDEFLKNIYNSTHVLEFLIDEGWDNFEKSIWNTTSVFDAIGYFNGRFLESTKERIAQFDSEEEDGVQEYIIETQIRLHENISEAMRFHQSRFESILDELELLIEKNTERRDLIYLEQWKQ